MNTILWAVGAAILAGAAGLFWRVRSARSSPPDHGTVSTSWLAEQKMASRDRFNS
jgi:hypothetical protein